MLYGVPKIQFVSEQSRGRDVCLPYSQCSGWGHRSLVDRGLKAHSIHDVNWGGGGGVTRCIPGSVVMLDWPSRPVASAFNLAIICALPVPVEEVVQW